MLNRLFITQLLLIVFIAFSFAQEESCEPSIRDNSEYVASTGLTLGADGGSSQWHEDGGFVIATTFQVNLEYQAGVDPDAVDLFNNYGEGTEHNWTDPEYYFMAISPGGGLAACSYGENNLEEDLF